MKKKILILSILAASTLGFAKYGWDAKTLVHLGTGFNPNSIHPNVSVTFYKELESKSKIGFKIGAGIELGYSKFFYKEEEKKEETKADATNGAENTSPASGAAASGSNETAPAAPAPTEPATGSGESTGEQPSQPPQPSQPSSSEENAVSGGTGASSGESSNGNAGSGNGESAKPVDGNGATDSSKPAEEVKLPDHGYGVGFASAELFGNVHEDVMLYGGGSIGYNFMFKKAEERSKYDNQLYVKGFVGITYKEIYTAEISYGSTNGLALGLGARIGF